MCLGSCQFLDFLGCLETGKVLMNTAGIDFVRARQKVREFFRRLFFWISFVKRDFEKYILFSVCLMSVVLFFMYFIVNCG